MFFFRSFKFNELVRNLPEGECTARLGGLRLWCLHRSPSLGLGLTPRSLGRSLSGNARVRFGFSCLANFGWGQNSPNTLRPLPRKYPLFFSAANLSQAKSREKFLKGENINTYIVALSNHPDYLPVLLHSQMSHDNLSNLKQCHKGQHLRLHVYLRQYILSWNPHTA